MKNKKLKGEVFFHLFIFKVTSGGGEGQDFQNGGDFSRKYTSLIEPRGA